MRKKSQPSVVKMPTHSTTVEGFLKKAVDSMAQENEGQMAGAVIVVWNARGECTAKILAHHGIVSEQFVPTLVSHHLNRLLIYGVLEAIAGA